MTAPDEPLVTPSTGRRRLVRNATDVVVLIVLALTAWFVWPASMGGNTRFIVVQGHSMEPVYHYGDVVLVKAHDRPAVGEIIVFRVPAEEPGAGMLVVHRVHGVRPDGSYETKGDNRELPDQWRVTSRDVLGEPRLTLPHFGRAIGLFSNPLVVGAAAGLLTVLFLWPRREQVAAANP